MKKREREREREKTIERKKDVRRTILKYKKEF